MTKDNTSGARLRLLVFAIVCLTNPVVNIFDYLPDFIGCFIIAASLRFYSDRVPHFYEARQAFIKLGILSIAKIPSYMIMVFIRGQNTVDNDIKSLFTFSFSVIEAILIVIAIKKLFEGLSYLGERGEAYALISPFPISKNKKRFSTPENLKNFSYIFFMCKIALTAIPEMFLLTKTVDAGNYYNVFNIAKFYPYTIVLSVLSVFIVGIILTKRFKKYLLTILAEGKMKSSAEEMITQQGKETLDKKMFVDGLKFVLSVFAVSSFFTPDLCFNTFSNINLAPNFIFGSILIFGIIKLGKYVNKTKPALVSTCIYTVSSIIAYVFHFNFLSSYSYEELARLKVVKSQYVSVILSSAIEFVLIIPAFVFLAIALRSFIVNHTGASSDNVSYSKTDKIYHRELSRKLILYSAFGILSQATKFLTVLFRYFSTNLLVHTDTELSTVTTSLVPWFNVIVLVSEVLFICYSLHIFGRLKDDAILKYS